MAEESLPAFGRRFAHESGLPAATSPLRPQSRTAAPVDKERHRLHGALVLRQPEHWRPSDVSTWDHLLLRATLAALVFCAVAGASYLINDVRDVESDRLHPTKRNRPIAAGNLGARAALGLGRGAYPGRCGRGFRNRLAHRHGRRLAISACRCLTRRSSSTR